MFRTPGNTVGSRHRRVPRGSHPDITGSLGISALVGRWEDAADLPGAPFFQAPGAVQSCLCDSEREKRGYSIWRSGRRRRPDGPSRRCPTWEPRGRYRCCWNRATHRAESKSGAGRAPESSFRFYRRRSRNTVIDHFENSQGYTKELLSRSRAGRSRSLKRRREVGRVGGVRSAARRRAGLRTARG